MKKILALALALCMIFALCACGQQAAPAPAAEAPAAEAPAAEAPAAEAPAAEQTVLKLWCIATESDANRPAYLQAIADYEAAHPDVKIEMEAFENESYKTKIKAAMIGGDAEDLPDIFFTWSGAFLGEFVNADKVQCLDEVYKDYTDKIPEVMLANTTYGGKHFGVPTTFNIVAMFANMDMLAEVGWDHVPETYEDLIACCDALVAAGKIPFGCAGKETWCVTEYLEPIIIRVTSIPPASRSATTRSRPTSSPARPPSIRTAPGTPARSTTPPSSPPSLSSRS